MLWLSRPWIPAWERLEHLSSASLLPAMRMLEPTGIGCALVSGEHTTSWMTGSQPMLRLAKQLVASLPRVLALGK